MGLQEELDALAARYQGQAFDPFENTQGGTAARSVIQQQAPQESNLPEWLAPLMQSLSGAVGPSAGILSQFTQQPDEYQNQPLSEVYPKAGLMGVGGEMMNRLQANTDPISQLTEYLMGQGKEVMFGRGQEAQAQAPSSLPQLPQQTQAEPTLREADPIAQISAMLASQGAPVRGNDQVVNSRGSFTKSNPISDSIQNANREAARELATRQVGQGSPLTDKERKERKMEDVMIGTPREPGLMGGVAQQDPEVMTQLKNSVRELYGLGPAEVEDLIKKDGGAGWQELLGGLTALGLTIVGGKLVRRATKGKDLPKMKTSAGSFPKGPRTGVKKAPNADDLVAKMRGSKTKNEVGAFKTGSANKAGGYQGTREVGMPERGFQMKGGGSSKAPSGAEIRASRNKQKALPAGEVPKRLEYLMDKKKLTPEELADLKDMFKGVFKQKK